LTQTLASFRQRLRESAETLDVHQRQKILRLLVKEVLVNEGSITIRHSIPIPRTPDEESGTDDATLARLPATPPSYLLRSGRQTAARCAPGDEPSGYDDSGRRCV
jgi:site-specific DNA recombinase